MANSSRILVVEDDAQVRAMVSTLLGRAGYRVEAVPRARDMRRAVAEGGVDLVLLDVLLPDGDGFEALRQLRESSDLPVIMLTGVDGPDDRVHGLESGADDYVCKPFNPNELIARVRSVLRRADGLGRA
ncbi:MAG: response regulator transcription factor, partial [Tistlia sp.]